MQQTSVSPDGAFVATVQPGSLVIRSGTSSGIVRTYKLPGDSLSRCKFIRWSREHANCAEPELLSSTNSTSSAAASRRILLADDDNIRVYDTADPKFRVTIKNAAGNLGRIDNVTFGWSSDEVLVFSDFGVKVTIWSLTTAKGVEIKDPKHGIACYDFRKQTGHMALLTRGGAQDVLMILKAGSNRLLRSVELATLDAQEVLWSGDGNWIAVRDCASTGHRILIYTADGHLYKSWCGEGMDEIDQGVRTMRFVEGTGNLMIGDFNDRVTFLKNETFSTMIALSHPHTIHSPKTHVWEEQIDAESRRSYVVARYPVSPSLSSTLPKPSTYTRNGVSVMRLNAEETLLATRTDTMPSTIWIWSMLSGALISVLIHHSPVKQIAWHPTDSEILLINCITSDPVVHVWHQRWESPKVLSAPTGKLTGKVEAAWLRSSSTDRSRVMVYTPQDHTVLQISNQDGDVIPDDARIESEAAVLALSTGPEDLFDEGNSLDLSPIKLSHSIMETGHKYDEGFGITGASLDDTFHYRKKDIS